MEMDRDYQVKERFVKDICNLFKVDSNTISLQMRTDLEELLMKHLDACALAAENAELTETVDDLTLALQCAESTIEDLNAELSSVKILPK